MQNVDRIDKICFDIFLIDIFFLPLFPFFSVSMSLPFLIYWFYKRGNRVHSQREYRYFPIIVVIMCLSTLISTFYPVETAYQTTFFPSFKRLLQYITSFWYFFFFKYYFDRYRVSINKVFFYALVYMALLALFYFLDRGGYADLKIILNPADNHTRRVLANEMIYRFNFLWVDPNNVAYATGAIFLTYISEEKHNLFFKVCLLFCTLFILFCTMSIGGMSITIASFMILLLLSKKTSKIRVSDFRSLIITMLVVIAVLIYVTPIIAEFLNSDIIDGLTSRIDYYESSDMSGGRKGDFLVSLSHLNPIFLFAGCGIEGFVSEIGHIYVLFMYGLPVYIYFIYVFFCPKKNIKWKRILPLLPMFVGFTINIAIIEQKFLLILLVISAYLSIPSTFDTKTFK